MVPRQPPDPETKKRMNDDNALLYTSVCYDSRQHDCSIVKRSGGHEETPTSAPRVKVHRVFRCPGPAGRRGPGGLKWGFVARPGVRARPPRPGRGRRAGARSRRRRRHLSGEKEFAARWLFDSLRRRASWSRPKNKEGFVSLFA